MQDSCSDTENGLCDTDSFGSRLSGNGSGSIAGEFKHIKEEIENDEDYFRLLANQTRTMRHFDGEFDESIAARRSKFQTCFFLLIRSENSFFSISLHSPFGRGLSGKIYGFSMAVERKSFASSIDATEWVICVLPNCRWWNNNIYGFIALYNAALRDAT